MFKANLIIFRSLIPGANLNREMNKASPSESTKAAIEGRGATQADFQSSEQ